MKSYIPTINISSLIKNNFNTKKANQTIKQIEKACVNVGFFQITGHGINLKEIKKITDIYGVDTVYDTLKRVYIRDTKPIENRTEKEANEIITRSKLKVKKNESE